MLNVQPVAHIFMRICNSKTFNPLPSTEFLGECHQPTAQTLMENPGRSRKEPWLGFRRQNTFFFNFLMSLRQLNGLQWHQKLYSWLKKLCQFKTYMFCG